MFYPLHAIACYTVLTIQELTYIYLTHTITRTGRGV